MRKQVVTILVLSWSLLAFAQTFGEEMRQEKIMFRQYEAVQRSWTSLGEEQRLRRERRAFIAAQRRAKAATEANEVRQLKRDYRAFLTEQNRQHAITAENTR